MYKMKVKKSYSIDKVNCITCKADECVKLPKDIATAWLEHGFCEEVKPAKSEPKKETKVINPVVEKKASKGFFKSKSKK
jgi:hypothetical protein